MHSSRRKDGIGKPMDGDVAWANTCASLAMKIKDASKKLQIQKNIIDMSYEAVIDQEDNHTTIPHN